eukprot:TRINITY_DN992_c0_g1_i1.p1 TRINITY_DN992_c0_g1~~TRINITY_DN992_c0_g1_i1.p1  ORF type:complete len:101 (+),score=13.43 TRINITY_DN992_c0_g1_i1:206-508(+)
MHRMDGICFAAASITATGSRLRLMQRVTPRSKPASNIANPDVSNPMIQPMVQPMIHPMVPSMIPNMIPPPQGVSPLAKYGWDSNLSSPHLAYILMCDGYK